MLLRPARCLLVKLHISVRTTTYPYSHQRVQFAQAVDLARHTTGLSQNYRVLSC